MLDQTKIIYWKKGHKVAASSLRGRIPASELGSAKGSWNLELESMVGISQLEVEEKAAFEGLGQAGDTASARDTTQCRGRKEMF